MARESLVEACLVREGKKRGVWVIKAEALFTGFPDRLLLAPSGRFALVELKSPSGKLRPAQRTVRRWLRGLGFKVHILRTAEQCERFYAEWLD